MKPSQFLTIFLLITLFSSHTISSAKTDDDFIYDIDGDKVVKNKVSYYIGPVTWAKGGGVKLTSTKCPVNAIQDPKEITKGDSFTFTLNAFNEQFLRLSYPLGITIKSSKSKCSESTFLKIDSTESKPPFNYITSGGGFNTAVSCFKIVNYPKPTGSNVKSYLIQHCPSVCGAGPPGCFNISTYVDNGIKYLASSGTPFEIVFKKAST